MDLTKVAEFTNPLITTVLSGPGIWAWARTRTQRNDSEDKLLLHVAKNQLVAQGREYLNRGYITMDEYEEYESVYKVYSDLGGNGLARRIFEQVDDLPMMPDGIDGRKNK
nr:MAG TPA: holin protein [Caudoviricetes sp.]